MLGILQYFLCQKIPLIAGNLRSVLIRRELINRLALTM